MYMGVGSCTHRDKPDQLFFISQILVLNNLKQNELLSAGHCFKLTVVAFLRSPVLQFKPV